MQEQKENPIAPQNLDNVDSINIKEELERLLAYWKWFVFGGVIALAIAYTYLRYVTPQYSASASIMIKDNMKSGISSELAAFEDLGIIGGGSANNPDNEIEILKSRKIIGNVVDSLYLTTSYFMEGRIKRSEMYTKSPVLLKFIKKNFLAIEKDTAFVVVVLDENAFEIKTLEGDLIGASKFNEIIDSKLGLFKISSLQDFKEGSTVTEVIISLSGRSKVIDTYRNRIAISSVDKNSSVLGLSLQDAVKEKAEDILDELVQQYNLDAIKDKNIVSEKTKDFIEERLLSVGSYLGAIQDDVKNYKTKFGITGLSAEGELALEAVSFNNQKIVEIQSQLSLADWIQKKLTKEATQNEVLPTNLGFTDVSITTSIQAYNELVLDKNKLLVTAGDKNPQLMAVQKRITTLNQNLLSSLANLRK